MSPIQAAMARSRSTIVALFFLLIAGAYAYITIPKESNTLI